ncbi:hypothetical protein EDC96DRAFT_574438 [Choanephora cucurbitarum]|nr:hypothetical protein EDC96DRAFT_574438 [Choanephora cucurbitarum]
MEINNNPTLLVKHQINFLSQLSNWAKIWLSSSHTQVRNPLACRAKVAPVFDPIKQTDALCQSPIRYDTPSESQLTHLYRLTCQKLVRKPNQIERPTRIRRLGDLVNVRTFWDLLEAMVYQEISNSKNYNPPSKRVPFYPDRPGSLFMPKRSKRYVIQMVHNQAHTLKRRSFASTTIIYTLSDKDVQQSTIEPNEDAEDSVPLETLRLRKHKS